MARKVIFAQANRGLLDNRRSIGVDEYVDIDMSVAVDPIRTEEEGAVVVTKPTYAIWARPRALFLDPHGHVVKKSDIEWLERTPRAYDEKFICRVNQINVTDPESGKSGFLVEITSGLDSRQIIRSEQFESYQSFAKEHWWKIGLAMVAAWWWLF